MREMRDKRDKGCLSMLASLLRAAEPCSRLVSLRRPEPTSAVTNGTIYLAKHCVLAICPFVIRRRLSSSLGWPGLSGGVTFPELSKLLNREDALSVPCYAVSSVFRRRALAGCGMLRTGVIRHFMSLYCLLHPSHQLARADVSPVVAADARAERTGARPSRAIVARRLRRLDLTSTLVRFLAGIKRESFPMQDEPERRTSFQHKMSLKA
jgi:hypothetical protein